MQAIKIQIQIQAKKMTNAIILSGVLLLLTGGFSAMGQAATPALAPVTALDIGAGVRPMGMGGAFTALANDENAVFYNPAGLAYLSRLKIGSFYEPRFGASFGDIAVTGQYLGAGLLFFNLGGIPQYDERDRPGKTFTYGSSALIAAAGVALKTLYAWLPENIALGLSFKSYQVSVLDNPGSGMALDLGLLWRQDLHIGALPASLRLGAAAENLLSLGIKYKNGHVEPWKPNLHLGSVLIIKNTALALDFESRGVIHLGGEYRYSLKQLGTGELALRLGGFLQGGLAFTLGFGISYQNFRVDYAFIAYPQAPDTHRLSFSMHFKLPRLF